MVSLVDILFRPGQYPQEYLRRGGGKEGCQFLDARLFSSSFLWCWENLKMYKLTLPKLVDGDWRILDFPTLNSVSRTFAHSLLHQRETVPPYIFRRHGKLFVFYFSQPLCLTG